MRVLTDPTKLESLPLPEADILELRHQLAIPGHDLQELWAELPARLIYLDEGDPTAMLFMALLAQLPPPEFEVSINDSLWLRLHVLNDYGAGLYFLSHKGGSYATP